MSAAIPTLVLGGTGYVAGELLRLLAGHPRLELRAVISFGSPGAAIEEIFPHLRGAYPGLRNSGREALPELLAAGPPVAVFAAGPHGKSAAAIDHLLAVAERAGTRVRLVDLSADFRHDDIEEYERIYGCRHGAPQRLPLFACALPEHAPEAPPEHAAHPGCFTTSVVLPGAALVDLGLIEPEILVCSVTGSTGAGRAPRPTTHHPERLSNLFAYKVLGHRHEPEMSALIEAVSGTPTKVAFAPHAGPFARGIHSTLHCKLRRPLAAAEVIEALAGYYSAAPFVHVQTQPPRLKEVVGTNHCCISVAARGERLVAVAVIDNLVKGAAGGAVQWMNRLFDLEESTGLMQPGLGWL